MKQARGYFRNLLNISSNIIPSSLLVNPVNIIALPTYHTISDSPLLHIKNLYKLKTTKEFIKDLDYLLKIFTPIELSEIKTIQRQPNNKKKHFHLSFDDGLRETYDTIMPILKQKGIPATFFLNPNFIDNKGLMHRYKVSLIIEDIRKNNVKRNKITRFIKRKMGIRREPINFLLTLKYPHIRILNEIAQLTETDFESYLKNQRPYLTMEQINSMIKEGFTFGAHSLDHPEYIMLTEGEQLKQTKESIRQVTETFHLNYNVFAFPFTDTGVSKSFFDTIYNSTSPCSDLSFGVAGLKMDIHPNHLQRIPMEGNLSGKEILKGEFLYYHLKSIFGKNVIKRN